MKIVFMGTPQFAVESLKTLIENKINVVAVITSPDRKSGRGLKLNESDVKKYAVEQNLKIMQPTNLKNEDFLNELKSLEADLFVVVAFRMLPKSVFEMPPKGTINLHASLLPNYRGAAPINWAIINNEQKTGNTTFFIEQKIDTGKIIFQIEVEITETENAGTLHDKLMTSGAKLLLKTVQAIENDDYPQMDQKNADDLKHAPKIFTENCEIDWNNNALVLDSFIRGMSPYPTAFTFLDDKKLKIYNAKPILEKHNFEIGKIISNNKTFIKIATKDGFIDILELQLAGKKRMAVKDFLNGYDFDE